MISLFSTDIEIPNAPSPSGGLHLGVAIKFNIPLVMYGENQWVEYSGGHLDEEGGENTLIRRKLNQNLRVKSGVDKLIEIGIKKKIFKKILLIRPG